MTKQTLPRQTIELIESGVAAMNKGDIGTAARAFKKALPKAPRDPALLNLMAVTEIEQGRPRSAMKFLQKAIKTAPYFSEVHNTLGVVHRQLRDIQKAITAFSRAVDCDPDNLRALLNLTHACNDANRSDLALEAITRLTALQPNDAGARYWQGMTRKALGDLDAAALDFRAAVALSATHGGAWWQLAGLKGIDIDADRAALEQALDHHADHPGEAAKIAFPLFLAYEQSGNGQQAAKYLAEGNALHHRAAPYDVAVDEQRMSDIAKVFAAPILTAPAGKDTAALTPLFVLGMPRSGTTLIEQILASHSRVHGAGECDSVVRAITRKADGPAGYPQSVLKWRDKNFHQIGDDIVEYLSAQAAGQAMVIDKTPRNFFYLGLIRQALPGARIIHCLRDPLDTAYSNYRQLFSSGNSYAYDQDDLVRYMRAYEMLMAHWRDVAGDGFLEVRYEDVVADQEAQTRRLLDYCGLDYEPACLDFHATERSVQTASAAQVRRKLYATSVRAWTPYADHIERLVQGLGID